MCRHAKIGIISLLIVAVALVAGCGKEDKAPTAPQAVEKKIIPKADKEEPPQTAAGSVAGQPAVPDKPADEMAAQAPPDEQAAKPEESEAALDLYNPAGKIDPFAPLFKKEQVVTAAESTKKTRRRSLLTPLEKVDISQLTLLGTILAKSGNRAMVADTSGKGYVVTVGTYIGMSSGRVVDILADRIVVEEEVENILGKISLRKRELKIQKPLGE